MTHSLTEAELPTDTEPLHSARHGLCGLHLGMCFNCGFDEKTCDCQDPLIFEGTEEQLVKIINKQSDERDRLQEENQRLKSQNQDLTSQLGHITEGLHALREENQRLREALQAYIDSCDHEPVCWCNIAVEALSPPDDE